VKFINHITKQVSVASDSYNIIDVLRFNPAGALNNVCMYTTYQLEATLFNQLQTINAHNKVKHSYNENYRLFANLVALNTKNGFRKKALMTLANSLEQIYEYFVEFDAELNLEYPGYAVFFDFAKIFPNEFYKPDFMLQYVYNYLELIFIAKRAKVKKKKKKKTLLPKLTVVYIPHSMRTSVTLRIMNAYFNKFAVFKKCDRISSALIYLTLAGKTSVLYRKKIIMYNKLLEKKRFF